jgi:hypothetical protein
MSSLFETNVARATRNGSRKEETMSVTKHEQPSQAVSCSQSACWAHLVSGFPGQNQVRQKLGWQAVDPGVFPQEPYWGGGCSGDPRSMSLLGLLKGRGLIGLLRLPDGVENAHPDIGQGSDRNGMALALGPLALVILLGPGFLVRTRPAKLVQGIAPRLDAAQPAMRDLLHPALKKNWRGAGERLPTAGTVIAAAVIAAFSQQTRSETFASSWQGTEELAVGMDQKKAFNLLVIVSNLLDQGVELVKQRHHQPRFGTRHRLGGVKARLLESLGHLLGGLAGPWILGLFEQGRQILCRGRTGRLQGRIGSQEFERRVLLQLAEQFQRDGVVGYASGSELIDQPGLHLHQAILVTGQRFEFLDLFAIGIEPTQILEVGTPGFGQQIGINGIRLGPGGGAPPFDGSRIHRVDCPPLLQQMGDQQSVGGLHNTCQLLFSSWSCYSLQVGVQLVQSESAMCDTDRSQLTALLVNAQRIMVVVGPVNAAKLHGLAPYLRQTAFLNSWVLILCRATRDSLMTSRVQKWCQGRTSFLNRSSRVEKPAFPRHM